MIHLRSEQEEKAIHKVCPDHTTPKPGDIPLQKPIPSLGDIKSLRFQKCSGFSILSFLYVTKKLQTLAHCPVLCFECHNYIFPKHNFMVCSTPSAKDQIPYSGNIPSNWKFLCRCIAPYQAITLCVRLGGVRIYWGFRGIEKSYEPQVG